MMSKVLLLLGMLMIVSIVTGLKLPNPFKSGSKVTGNSIFEFDVPANGGGSVSLSKYEGKKAYLIVNVASK